MKIALGVLVAILLLPFLFLFAISTTPTLRLDPPVNMIGMQTPVKVQVENSHGIRRMRAYLEQNGKQFSVFEATEPTRRFFIERHRPPKEVAFTAGKKQAGDLKDGKALLVVEAVSNDFRGATARVTQDVEVNTKPLTVSADGAQHYINQGGAELVTFEVSGYWTEAGVRVGNRTFRSFPMPGETDPHSSKRFALSAKRHS